MYHPRWRDMLWCLVAFPAILTDVCPLVSLCLPHCAFPITPAQWLPSPLPSHTLNPLCFPGFCTYSRPYPPV